MKTTSLRAAALLSLFAVSAHASVLLEESFSYPNGALLGQGGWTITGTSNVNPLAVSGGSVALATTGQDAYKALAASQSFAGGASLYYSVDVTVSAAQATGDYFFHFSDPSGTTTNFYSRLYIKSATGGFVLGLMESSGTAVYGTTVVSFDTPLKLVMSYNSITGASNDTLALYVNPGSATEGSNSVYLTRTSAASSEAVAFSAVNLRQGTAANAPTLTVDKITVATTFGEAAGFTTVPEPSAYAAILGGMTFAGVVATRRRRA